jgi:hypothetical protein
VETTLMDPIVLLGLLYLATVKGKHGAELPEKRREKSGVTLRAYADGFIRLTSTKTDFYLPPRKRTAAAAVEVARGTRDEIATVIRFAADNFE